MTEKVGKSSLRSFGFIVAGGFAVIALWPMVFRGESPRSWALAISIVMSSTGLIYPPILKPVFKVWMAIGEVLGWINTRIILSVLFYGLIVPIGFFLRMTKKDPMQRAFDRNATTYRIPRTKRPATHMQRQF
jgi:polyferredoxin